MQNAIKSSPFSCLAPPPHSEETLDRDRVLLSFAYRLGKPDRRSLEPIPYHGKFYVIIKINRNVYFPQ